MLLTKYEKITWALTVFLLSAITIFENSSMFKYVFFFISLLIYFVQCQSRGKLSISLTLFHISFGLFAAYSFVTVLWAVVPNDSFKMGITLLEIFICYSLLFEHYRTVSDYHYFTNALKWSGLIIAAYAFYYYGFETIIQTAFVQKTRLENEFTNINSLGIICSISSFIIFHDFLFKKSWEISLIIPLAIIVAATQSRKALFLFISSLIICLIAKYVPSIRNIKVALRLLILVLMLVVLVYELSKLDIFSGIVSRVDLLLNLFRKNSLSDGSSLIRKDLVELGFYIWLSHPVFGIGIDNSHVKVFESLGHNYYLHNNYVELLADGGLVAFLLYYFPYIYLFINTLKKYKNNIEVSSFIIVLIIVLLFLDYGLVSYYSKTHWIYLMFLFVINKHHLENVSLDNKESSV